MSKFIGDGIIIGRLGAIALIVAVGFGLHRLGCGTGEMCPVMKTDSCCAGAAHAKAGSSPVSGLNAK